MTYSFDVDHATQYGVEEAIAIYNFQFWISKNKANGRNRHSVEIDGKEAERTWTYNSIRAYGQLFPFWSIEQRKRILKSLIEQKVLITGNYNKSNIDRTKWYAFRDENAFIMPALSKAAPIGGNQPMHFSKSTNAFVETNQAIPDLKPDRKPNGEGKAGKPAIPQPEIFKNLAEIRKSRFKALGDLGREFKKNVAEMNAFTDEERKDLLAAYQQYIDSDEDVWVLEHNHCFAAFWKDLDKYIRSFTEKRKEAENETRWREKERKEHEKCLIETLNFLRQRDEFLQLPIEEQRRRRAKENEAFNTRFCDSSKGPVFFTRHNPEDPIFQWEGGSEGCALIKEYEEELIRIGRYKKPEKLLAAAVA